MTKHYPELNLKAQSLITSLPAGKAAEFSHCWCKYTETLLNEMCSQSVDQRREQNKLIGNALADALIALNQINSSLWYFSLAGDYCSLAVKTCRRIPNGSTILAGHANRRRTRAARPKKLLSTMPR